MIEHRETLYELYIDGSLLHEGSYEACKEESLHALDDDCAEIYKVVITEERVL
jgi:hypothetical protein